MMKRMGMLLTVLFLTACSGRAKTSQLPLPDQSSAEGRHEYRLGPEDVVEVFVWKEPEMSTTVMVRPDGKISLPLVGEMAASGKTAAQLQGEMREKLSQYLTDPFVNVLVKEVNSPKISVLGEVHKPDRYPIRQPMTLLDAIALAGGFTEFARQDEVIVMRNGSSGVQRIKFNAERLLREGQGEPFYVRPSDTIYVK